MARTTGATANRPQIVTADQLAPSVNPAAANSANPARRPRRPRRPRRTPSQISVTSLPEYMKEPGAEEVVIFRYVTCVSICAHAQTLSLLVAQKAHARCLSLLKPRRLITLPTRNKGKMQAETVGLVRLAHKRPDQGNGTFECRLRLLLRHCFKNISENDQWRTAVDKRILDQERVPMTTIMVAYLCNNSLDGFP